MTRQTNSPAPSAHGADDLQQAATTAAALIELAVHESQSPIETLGRALARLSALLPLGSDDVRAALATCIENLQFHDRMVQQLTQVRDLLASATIDQPAMTSPPGWPALRERLRTHFTSESHRMLFNLLLPGEEVPVPMHLHAEEGSVELF